MILGTRVRHSRACGVLLFVTAAAGAQRRAFFENAPVHLANVCPMQPTRNIASASTAAPSSVSSRPRNVLGTELECCCLKPKTGFYRDGYCQTGEQDFGRHTVCAIVTADFLEFSKRKGNDLSTPNAAYGFPGLRPGDKWCLCALRWKEAFDAEKAGVKGITPKVVLAATHAKTLEYVGLDDLVAYQT